MPAPAHQLLLDMLWRALLFVVVHSSQLAQQQAQAYAATQAKEPAAIADQVQHVRAQWFTCEAEAAVAIAAYEGQGPGLRGRRPRPWRYHAGRYRIVAASRRTRRARRGRPAKTDPAPLESDYRLVVEVKSLTDPMVSNLITCGPVTHWASTTRGMKRPQRIKAVGSVKPLERGKRAT